MGIDNDIINKKYNSCGCIQLSQLNILENIIIDTYIQICKYHFNGINNKSDYIYNNKLKSYQYNDNLSLSNTHNIKNKRKIKKSLSCNSTFDYYNTQSENSNKIIEFGKYKNKTYEYVFNKDKMYCYKLTYWSSYKYTNKKILDFIQFIKNKQQV